MSASVDPLFTAEEAARIVPHRAFAPAHAFFARHTAELQGRLGAEFPAWDRAVLQENPDNFGVYFWHRSAAVPFLWLGLGWAVDDPPDLLPSWGVSLEVNHRWVAAFHRGDAGLRAACETADRAAPPGPRLHRFEGHVELAAWQPFEWLLETPDQPAALLGFWSSFLSHLAEAGVPEAAAEFARIAHE